MDLKVQYELKSHDKAVVSLKYSEDGEFLASASADKKVHISRTSDGKLVTTLEGEHTLGVNDCAWITDSLIATGSDDCHVKIWDIEKSVVISSFKGNKSFVYSLAVNPINRSIGSGGFDGSINVYHLSSRDPVMSFSGHSEPIVSIDYNSNGNEYITGGQDSLIRVWDSRGAAACIKTIICSEDQYVPISSVRYTPDGRYMLCSMLDHQHKLYKCEHFLTSAYDNCIRQFTGHTNSRYSIFSLVYASPLGTFVVSGSEDNKVYLWDFDGKEDTLACVAGGHQEASPVLAVAGRPCSSCTVEGESRPLDSPYVHDEFQLASSCQDGSVKLWETGVNGGADSS